MNKEAILRKGVRLLPNGMRDYARMVYRRGKHWAHPDLKGFGTVQDLYYWASDGNLHTLLLLQNYFSALYPRWIRRRKAWCGYMTHRASFWGFASSPCQKTGAPSLGSHRCSRI